jgi:proline iminopeptidase
LQQPAITHSDLIGRFSGLPAPFVIEEEPMITKRALLCSAIAGLGFASFASATCAASDSEIYPIPGHPGHRIPIRGKQLYVDVSGNADAPTLVYIHGGPGAGSYDFGLYQRERLSQSLRLVQFDQRGALRSEAVGDEEPFTLNDLVEDTEALRDALGVERWSVVCHSFGGLVATQYALAYPHRVEKVIFENPSFDIGSSDLSMTRMFAEAARKAGAPDKAYAILSLLKEVHDSRSSWEAFGKAGRLLGLKQRLDLYAPFLPSGYFFTWMANSGLSQDIWLKGSGGSQATLWRDPACFEALQPRLAQLTAPALLIKGRLDANTGPDQMKSFAREVPRGRIVTFAHSGHMTHAEEADRFAEIVHNFVMSG